MEPYYVDEWVTLYHGDALDVLAGLADGSVDCVCTDPPYSLGFMGREWDSHDGRYQGWCRLWATECLRVLKPGGHLLAFGGTRTHHRLACAIEDAGFEIRDSIAWLYGSGFPKSLDVSKAIDRARQDRPDWRRLGAWLRARRGEAGLNAKQLCAAIGAHGDVNHGGAVSNWENGLSCPTWEQWLDLQRALGFGTEMDTEVWRLNGRKGKPGEAWSQREVVGTAYRVRRESDVQIVGVSDGEYPLTAPAAGDARRWAGWGTALKPAHEPIVVARKPLAGTVAGNVLTHGTGALNVDGCRIETTDRVQASAGKGDPFGPGAYPLGEGRVYSESVGRWPPNVVLDETTAAELDRQSGVSRDGVTVRRNRESGTEQQAEIYGSRLRGPEPDQTYGSEGGASRFFPVFRYEPKAPTAERPRVDGDAHETVKPLDLMRWLVRLVTPPGGLVLDPFAGSGTTAEACVIEGFRCIAVERAGKYLPLIVARLSKPIQPVLIGEV
jgi:predicted methyltransferase